MKKSSFPLSLRAAGAAAFIAVAAGVAGFLAGRSGDANSTAGTGSAGLRPASGTQASDPPAASSPVADQKPATPIAGQETRAPSNAGRRPARTGTDATAAATGAASGADAEVAAARAAAALEAERTAPLLFKEAKLVEDDKGVATVTAEFSHTFSGKDAAAARNFISVSPAVDFTVAHSWRALSVAGDFKIGVKYTVTFRKGLASTASDSHDDEDVTPHHALATNASFSFTLTDLPPLFEFAARGRYLTPVDATAATTGGDAAAATAAAAGNAPILLPIKTRNIPRAQVSVAKVPAQNIIPLFSRENGKLGYEKPSWWERRTADDHSTFEFTGAAIGRIVSLPKARNVEHTRQIDLREFLPKAGAAAKDGSAARGIFLVSIRALKNSGKLPAAGKTPDTGGDRDGDDDNDDDAAARERREAASAVFVHKFPTNYGTSSREFHEHRLVCVSDIGLSVHEENGEWLVWATSLSTSKPVAGATVTLRLENNTAAATATTDADGIARLKPAKKSAAGAAYAPFIITAATRDGDATFLPLNERHRLEVPAVTAAGARPFPAAGTAEAFVFSDRGIYRHGEPIRLQALLRDATGSAPAPFPVSLAVLRPSGAEAAKIPLMPDATGAVFAPEIFIKDTEPSGRWTFNLLAPGAPKPIGSRTVSVEEFVQPQVRVALDALPADNSALPADSVSVRVNAEWLFGGAAAELPAAGILSLVDAPFAPKAPEWDGFTFGDPRVAPVRAYPRAKPEQLDAAGAATLTFSTNLPRHPAAAIRAVFEGIVTEPGGRPAAARGKALTLHTAAAYLGVAAEGYAVVGEPRKFALALVAPDGKRAGTAAGGVEVNVSFFRLRSFWNIHRVEGRNGARDRYEFKEEVVREKISTKTVRVPAGANGSVTFKPIEWGRYEIVAEASGNTAAGGRIAPVSRQFWAGDFEEESRGLEVLAHGGSRLNVAFDKPFYAPGETARAAFEAPFAGTALVTVRAAAGGVSAAFSRPVRAGANTLEIPLGAGAAPSVEVAITLVRPVTRGVESGFRLFAANALQVRRPNSVLDVKPRASVAMREVGATVDVAVEVRPAPDNATAAGTAAGDALPVGETFVTIALADEGIHLLTNEPVPSPADYFAVPRLFNVVRHDFFNRLVPLVKPAGILRFNAAAGGDEANGLLGRVSPVKSRRFAPLALWTARVPVENGVARTRFDLPEFSGEVRVTAVAWSAAASGSAKVAAKVAPKIVPLPDGPRFLAPGDKSEIVLTLHNRSGAPQEVAVESVFTNATGDFPRRVSLANGASKTLRGHIAAAGAGSAKVAFTIAGAGEKRRVALDFPVRPAAAAESVVAAKIIPAGASAAFAVPVAFAPEFSKQTLQIRDDGSVELLPALRHLTHYPYGCLEQTTSSAYPLVAAAGEGRALLAGDAQLAANAPRLIRATFNRLALMWRGNAFAYWPDGAAETTPSEFALHAAQFICEARAGDPSLPEFKGLADFLKRHARSADADIAAHAALALAIAGAPDAGAMSTLADRAAAGGLSECATFRLARALARAGDTAAAGSILEKSNHRPAGATGIALNILALLDAKPDSADLPLLLAHLRALRGKNSAHWGTTWDNVHALHASLAWLRRATADASTAGAGGFRFEIAAPDTETIARENVRAFDKDFAGTATVVVRNTGTVPLHVLHTTLGVPREEPKDALAAGIKIERTFFRADGTPLDPARDKIKQGETLVARIAVTPLGEGVNLLAIAEPLPACLEVEAANFLKAGDLGWVPEDAGNATGNWVEHREARDDRVFFFGGKRPLDSGREHVIYHSARVVSKGAFVFPAVSAEGMYAPEIRARTAPARIVVKE